MRTLWNVVSFLAVVHLLALAMFMGWLLATQRLDGPRLEQLRAVLARPVGDEGAAETPGEPAETASTDSETDGPAPVSSAVRVHLASLLQEQMQQSIRWLEDEKRMLTAQLARATAQIEQQERQFAARQAQWEESIEADRQRKIDDQFGKAVRQLESIPPKQGRLILAQLVAEGRIDQAVAYLDAMNSRAAAKVLREFKAEGDVALATELLERLRTFGLTAEGAVDSSHDADLARPDEPESALNG